MKQILNLMLGLTLLGACSSKEVNWAKLNPNAQNTELETSISTLKETILHYTNKRFAEDLRENRIDTEDGTSLREHAFKYLGKTRAPVNTSTTTFYLTEKELGKKVIPDTAGPLDVIEDSKDHFLFYYNQILFEGRAKDSNKTLLKVLSTKKIEPIVQEVKTSQKEFSGPLWFESLVLDLDKAIKEGERNFEVEWSIAKELDPKAASTLLDHAS